MFDRAHRFLAVVLFLVDFFALVAAFGFAYVIRVMYDDRPLLEDVAKWDYLWSTIAIIPVWIMVFFSLGLYRSRVYLRHTVELVQVIWGCFIGILLVIGWEYVTNDTIFPARLVMVYVFLMSIVLVYLGREIAQVLSRWVMRRRYGSVRMLVIGDSEVATSFIEQVAQEPSDVVRVAVFMGPESLIPKGSKVKHFADFGALDEIIKHNKIQVIVQTGTRHSNTNQQILAAAEKHHIQYCFVPGEPEFYSRTNTVGTYLDFPIVTVSQTPLTGVRLTLKRLFDLALVVLAAPVWGLVLLLLMVLQKILNPGPVFFKQKRLGRHGKKIEVYKFRTMWQKWCGPDAIKIFKEMGRDDLAEEYRKTRKIENDPRIAGWFGKMLRKTSLDELPQLINVLRGDMSLVGPRPIIEDELDFYKQKAPLLLSVTPGLTGLASVSGRSDISFERRVSLELYYASNWTFMMDIKILLKTVIVVLFGKGSK